MTHAGVRVALQLQPSGQSCTSLDAGPFRSLGADCRSTPSLGHPLEARYRSPLGGAHEPGVWEASLSGTCQGRACSVTLGKGRRPGVVEPWEEGKERSLQFIHN